VRRLRLRPAYDEKALRRIYATPHDHTLWLDHKVRVAVTVALTRSLSGHVPTAADLSCGDGAILRAIDADVRHYGDYAPGHERTGPVEETIHTLPTVDLYVCCETVEHLDDPDVVLKNIRAKAKTLVLSTPVDAWGDDNVEHLWAWDREAVESMLRVAGFEPLVYTALDLHPAGGTYQFGIWWSR